MAYGIGLTGTLRFEDRDFLEAHEWRMRLVPVHLVAVTIITK